MLPYLKPRERAELESLLRISSFWEPLPGPQTAAYYSPADILFYGGQAGGGKTDLVLGLSLTAHHRAIVFRREYKQLKAIEDRAREIIQDRGSYNSSEKIWTLPHRRLEFGAVQNAGDEQGFQGRPHDLKAFDEITHFLEAQFRFLIGWLRSPNKKQRKRVVCTGNPPLSAEGDWVLTFFGPWLDDHHPNPADPGELRFYTTIDGKDVEVPNGEPIKHGTEILIPLSRTFIPASIDDNPYLLDTGYKTQLQALPEPLRSKMLYGSFKAGREDHERQVIPTAWVQAAQERWKQRTKPDIPMTSLGVDVARGGKDKTVLAPRYANWFDWTKPYPGTSTPDGPAVAGLVMLMVRGTGAVVNIDVIGVGSSPYDALKQVHPKTVPMNSAEASEKTDKSKQLRFVNQRAEWWWIMREALDPETGDDLALPPDRELLADLCAPRWELKARGIQIESKDDVIKRIMRSPDKGDAVVYAHAIKHIPGTGLLDFYADQAAKLKAEQEKKQ